MSRASALRRSQRFSMGQRKVKAEAPRCLPRLEQCEDRLPPGQLFDFFFDPVGDVLPLFLGATARDHIRNAAAVQSDLEVSLLSTPASTQHTANANEQAGLDLLGLSLTPTSAETVRASSVDQTLTTWTGTMLAGDDLFSADQWNSMFKTGVNTATADNLTSSSALVRDRVATTSGAAGARFANPADVTPGVASATADLAGEASGAIREQLLNVVGITTSNSVTLTGKLQVFTPASEDGHLPDQYQLQVGDQNIPLLVDERLSDFGPGDVVTVQGELLPDGLLTSPAQLTLLEQAPPPAEENPSTGPGPTYRTVLVISVNFQDRQTTPWTIASVENLFDNTIAPWYLDTSYGRMTTYTDAAGWYTLNTTSTTCNYSSWATMGQNAASAQGYAPNLYNHVVIAFPRVPACNWSGLGQMPGRLTWLNQAMSHGVAVHELGHNLGLAHSHSRRCNAGPLDGSCTQSEYGDPFEVMGNANGRAGHHASYRSYVGWIPASDRVLVTPAMGEVYLELYSTAVDYGPRVIQVRRSGGQTNSLYIEWREAVGADSVLRSYPVLLNGVAIYLGANNNFRDQSVVDINYQTSSANDAALQIGEILYDWAGDVAIVPYDRADGVTYIYVVYGING